MNATPAPAADRPRRWGRLVAGNAAVTLVLLLGLGLAGEAYYRFIYDSTDSFGLTRACQRWFERHYHGNNFGVRDSVDYAHEPAPGRRRLTFLGDSFTAGHGIADVEARFANRVRQALGAEWEVHVLAANGIDTGFQVESLAAMINAGYDLDVLVLVYVLNDIADLVPEWGAILERIYAGQGSEPFWVRRSYLFNMLYYRWKAARDPDIAHYYGFVQAAYAGPLWDEQRRRLAGLHDLCRSQGASLLVVTFPFLHALGPEYPYADIHARLGAWWAGEGVPHLDLLEHYHDTPARALVIGRQDAHPNRRAHALAAEAITDFVRTQTGPPSPREEFP